MIFANDFAAGTDSETIEAALAHLDGDRTLVIAPRASEIEPERSWWSLDRAILPDNDTTIILRNVKLKLSDRCRDNFIRSRNAGLGIADPEPMRNIRILGEGIVTLEGADRPRATGDSSKRLHAPCPHEPADVCRIADWVPAERRTLEKLDFWDIHDHTYGTDALREDESQWGDWRGIGILLANVTGFTISGLRLCSTHGWGISLEACSYGNVERIDFSSTMYCVIDGMKMNIENQDGIDLRNGCHHITVSDVTGITGDDVVALTAIADRPFRPGGSLRSTHVMPNDWDKREPGIHDVVIRNVIASSYLCFIVRLLSAECRICNVIIDGVVDTAPKLRSGGGTILLGESDSAFGVNLRDGLSAISISHVITTGRAAVSVNGYLRDSAISNVICATPGFSAVRVKRPEGLCNVALSGIVEAKEGPAEA